MQSSTFLWENLFPQLYTWKGNRYLNALGWWLARAGPVGIAGNTEYRKTLTKHNSAAIPQVSKSQLQKLSDHFLFLATTLDLSA